MSKETMYTILVKVKSKELNLESALYKLAEIGYCPNLLNDDDGRWAVCFDGMQTVPLKGASDINSHFFVHKKQWKSTPMKALIYALQK